MKKILFIGAGNMGQAIIGGLIEASVFDKSSIFIYEINEAVCRSVIEKYQVNQITNLNIKKDFNIIILAIKPQVFLRLSSSDPLVSFLRSQPNNTLFISILAGIKIINIEALLGNERKIVRVMPNTPALIRKSMTGISFNTQTDNEDVDLSLNIFNAIGETEILDEVYLDAVTGLSGSGPAFVFAFIEALTQGGVYSGLSKKTSEKLAVQTVLGAATMALNESVNGQTAIEDLRHSVTSPGGTTIEGLVTLEDSAFRSAVINAVKNAKERSVELSKK